MILKYKQFESIKKPRNGIIIPKEDIADFDIPKSIVDKMMTWDVIFKSPYSNSFYNSTNIHRGFKPDGCLRVSDHWNYITKDGTKHCITYDDVIETRGQKVIVSIGEYNKKDNKYRILRSERSPSYVEFEEKRIKNLQHIKDPKNQESRRDFKDRVLSGDVYTTFTYRGKEYSGILKRYTGNSIRIEGNGGNVVFIDNYLDRNREQKMLTYDKYKNPIPNPVYDDLHKQAYPIKESLSRDHELIDYLIHLEDEEVAKEIVIIPNRAIFLKEGSEGPFLYGWFADIVRKYMELIGYQNLGRSYFPSLQSGKIFQNTPIGKEFQKRSEELTNVRLILNTEDRNIDPIIKIIDKEIDRIEKLSDYRIVDGENHLKWAYIDPPIFTIDLVFYKLSNLG